jgi:hypothetical protein
VDRIGGPDRGQERPVDQVGDGFGRPGIGGLLFEDQQATHCLAGVG